MLAGNTKKAEGAVLKPTLQYKTGGERRRVLVVCAPVSRPGARFFRVGSFLEQKMG